MQKPFNKKMTNKSPMYVYATEMISSYYKLLKLKNKKILTIVGSGDQVINAYFFGAKEVVGFDINKYAFFILELKISAIINLSFIEFIKFFGKNNNTGSFNFDLYNKLRKNLSKNVKIFFDKIYKSFEYNGKKLIKSDYFRQRSMIETFSKEINIYLINEKNYLKCRQILKNRKATFFNLDLNNIANIKNKFDIINLSNVPNYLMANTEEDKVAIVLSNILRKITKIMNKNGLFFYYSYSPNNYICQRKAIPIASRINIIKEIAKINNFNLYLKKFKGINKNTFDKINIFKLKK